jgi:hypothetical protein
MPKDGLAPLEGIVEADWAVVPFTMNWKLIRTVPVGFEADVQLGTASRCPWGRSSNWSARRS